MGCLLDYDDESQRKWKKKFNWDYRFGVPGLDRLSAEKVEQ